MRNALLYLLLFATLLPTVSQWGTIAYYQVNKTYIARVLCENRNKPQLHCDGQCYLAKRLKAQQDRQDKETTQRVQNIAPIQLFCESGLQFTFAAPAKVVQQPVYRYVLAHYSAPSSGLLRPPGSPV